MDNINIFQNKITGKLEGIEDDKAVVRLSDGQTIHIPLTLLPQSVQVGDNVNLYISTENMEEKDRNQLAKDILNEVLNIDNS